MSDDDKRVSLRNGDDNVCRDFLRNVCGRGKNCKFSHPNGNEVEQLGRQAELVFCHDFQNKECHRPSCRFVHCTRQEEEFYHRSGELPELIQQMLSSKTKVVSSGKIPICKDYLKGDCRRGGRCKFRHLSPGEPDVAIGCANGSRITRNRFNEDYETFERRDRFDMYERRESYEPDLKRRHFDDYSPMQIMMSPADRHPFTQLNANEYQMVQEENNALRRKVEALRKQVADLTATNEFLLDQNAQLRLSKPSTGVNQAAPPGLNPQQNASAAVPPIIAQISQQLPIAANTAELSASALQSAQPIAVPVSLAQALAPVSLASVTIAQQLPAAVSLAQSLPQSIITMSGPSTPLVSYPIMTQSMRPPLPQSSLAH